MIECQWSQQKNICKSHMGQDQVSGGVSVLCPLKRIMHKFSLQFWCGYLHQPKTFIKKYYNNSLSFYLETFKHSF